LLSIVSQFYFWQAASVESYSSQQVDNNDANQPGTVHQYTIACIEVEMSRVNAFVLSSDAMRCGDCFVGRIDQLKVNKKVIFAFTLILLIIGG